MPTVQRRSKPVNGSVLAFSLVGVVLVFAGAVSLAGVVEAGFSASFDGATPLLGVVVVVGVVVGAGVVVL